MSGEARRRATRPTATSTHPPRTSCQHAAPVIQPGAPMHNGLTDSPTRRFTPCLTAKPRAQ